MGKQTYYWAIGAAALLVGAFAVTNQSLWIDEGAAALKAMEPSLGDWWRDLRSEGNSNLQLIGELFYLWVWEKIFGASEVALRASNIPFFVGGVVALAWGMGPRRVTQNCVVLLALTNAFLWYYLSEARPYIVLFGFASLTAACLLRLVQEPDDSLPSAAWFPLFCAGVVGLCLTSLIAVPWGLGAMAAVLYWSGPRAVGRCALRYKATSGLTIAAIGALGLYYLWTLQLEARASDVGRTGWSNIVFIFYELLGLAGLGPGRLDLRAEGTSTAFAFLPLIVLGAIVVLALLLAGFIAVQSRIERRRVLFFTIAVAVPCACVLVAGSSGRMRLLGRHLTPLLPFLLALMAAGLASLISGPALWKKSLAVAILGIVPISALEIRLAPRHRRDDYRSAAVIARQALKDGQRVWWLADVSTGLYYQVPLGNPQITTSPDLPRPKVPPDMVIFSKPDIYDSSGTVRRYLARNGFTVKEVRPAFEIWQPSPGR